jgi:hypothetical protein
VGALAPFAERAFEDVFAHFAGAGDQMLAEDGERLSAD